MKSNGSVDKILHLNNYSSDFNLIFASPCNLT